MGAVEGNGCSNGPAKQMQGSGVAQLAERLPPTPEVRGSNPVIGDFLINIDLLSTLF